MLTINEINEAQKSGKITATQVFHLMNEYVGMYKDLARERGKLIINSHECGYLSIPSEPDPAAAIFARCNMQEDHAINFILDSE